MAFQGGERWRSAGLILAGLAALGWGGALYATWLGAWRLDQAEREIGRLRASEAERTRRLAEVEAGTGTIETLNRARVDVQAQRDALMKLEAARRETESRLDTARAASAILEERLTERTRDLADLGRRLREAEDTLAARNAQASAAEERRAEASAEVAGIEARLAEAGAALDAAREDVRRATQDREAIAAETQAARERLDGLREEVGRAQTELRRLKEATEALRRTPPPAPAAPPAATDSLPDPRLRIRGEPRPRPPMAEDAPDGSRIIRVVPTLPSR